MYDDYRTKNENYCDEKNTEDCVAGVTGTHPPGRSGRISYVSGRSQDYKFYQAFG